MVNLARRLNSHIFSKMDLPCECNTLEASRCSEAGRGPTSRPAGH